MMTSVVTVMVSGPRLTKSSKICSRSLVSATGVTGNLDLSS